MVLKRVNYSSTFKAKVALAAFEQEKTMSQLSSQFKVHPAMIGKWKSQLLERVEEIFLDGRKKKNTDEPDTAQLYQQIGQLKVELDWLKKKSASFT
jgi:putative transposase